MKRSSASLELSVVWRDEHIQEVIVSASSENFSGAVHLYTGLDEMVKLADVLHGFPVNANDQRKYQLGQAKLEGYGTAHLVFSCLDSTGHVSARVDLRSGPLQSDEWSEFALVRVTAVAADIDRFEQQLRAMRNEIGACAVLQSAA